MSPSLTSLVEKSTAGRSGTKALASGSVGIGMLPPAVPTASSDPGCAHDQVVRHRVGVEEHDLHGLAGLDGEPFDVEAELLGQRLDADDLHAERPQVAPDGALRARRAASLPAFRQTGWRRVRRVRSGHRPAWPDRRRRWREQAVRSRREARRCRESAAATRWRPRAGQGRRRASLHAPGSRTWPRQRRAHPRASSAAVLVTASSVDPRSAAIGAKSWARRVRVRNVAHAEHELDEVTVVLQGGLPRLVRLAGERSASDDGQAAGRGRRGAA